MGDQLQHSDEYLFPFLNAYIPILFLPLNIVFDYKIKPGNLTNTNAIRILELNNYPKELVNEANLLAEQIYKNKIV